MGKYMIARQMSSKRVITNEGEEFGKLIDLNVSETTGKIETLVIEASPDSAVAEKLRKEDGMVLIPYESVLAINDYVIVEKRNLTY